MRTLAGRGPAHGDALLEHSLAQRDDFGVAGAAEALPEAVLVGRGCSSRRAGLPGVRLPRRGHDEAGEAVAHVDARRVGRRARA